MTTSEWIAAISVGVQVLLFAGLMWYCIETRKLRIASQGQLEALQTPCVTFHAAPRDATDAVLDMGCAEGDMILDFIAGDAVLINIGNGPAVNISYTLTPMDNAKSRPDGYVSSIPPRVRCSVAVSRGILQGHRYDCRILYGSLSQTRYETRLTVNNLVLTPPFHFGKAS